MTTPEAEEVGGNEAPLRGELRLLVQQHRSTVVDAIAAFKKRYPEVWFRIDYEQEGKGPWEYDLCISHAQPGEEYDQNLCLITEQLKLVVSSDHPLAKELSVGFEKQLKRGT